AQALKSQAGVTEPGPIQQAIYNALGPNGLGILGNLNDPADITPDDVGVAFSNGNNDVTITLHLAKTVAVASTKFDFSLGLPGMPLEVTPQSNGTVAVSVGFDLANLTFGAHNSNQYFVGTAQPSQLSLVVDASLKDVELRGKIGFLQLRATDASPGQPEFHG